MNAQDIWQFLTIEGVDFGIKLVTAIVVWVIGRWLISLAVRLMGKVLERGAHRDFKRFLENSFRPWDGDDDRCRPGWHGTGA